MQRGDVEQHAARDDPVFADGDRVAHRAGAEHLRGVEAVVHLALVEDVAERVDVCVGHSVRGDREVVAGRLEPAQARLIAGVAGHRHHVHHRRRIVRRGRLGQFERAGDGRAVPHQRGRRGGGFGRDEVERAAFVIRPPAPPVGQLLRERVDIGAGSL